MDSKTTNFRELDVFFWFSDFLFSDVDAPTKTSAVDMMKMAKVEWLNLLPFGTICSNKNEYVP